MDLSCVGISVPPTVASQIDILHVELGLNPYDVRRKCNRAKDGELCYREMDHVATWMNDGKNKVALGANPSIEFEACNMGVNEAFSRQGDGAHNSALLLPDLINDGVRLLVYAGNAGKHDEML